jgi:1,2-diacylglycerol-3-alpha-glucose alpha-1,2-glucosyltransferase
MSKEETEGIVVLEALACSIPVLVRDIPVYDGWLQDGENVYKGRDVHSFVQKTAAILDHRAEDLTANGRRTAEARSIRETGKQLLDIYRTCLGLS